MQGFGVVRFRPFWAKWFIQVYIIQEACAEKGSRRTTITA